ncbi:hypothetical protein LB505_012584 [Fusarium chuoi]|nr:hypothetical protein LB505_012584 [Fusarium chuoi]
MKAVKSFIKSEDDGKINWSPNGGAMYAVVNKDEKNPYGENPGYRIVPGLFRHQERSPPHNPSSLRYPPKGQRDLRRWSIQLSDPRRSPG